jgi:hypothetical protein
VATGKERRVIQLNDPAHPHGKFVYYFHLHPSRDGKHVATLERMFDRVQTTRLAWWETATGKLVRQHSLPADTRVCAWLAGGALIALPLKDGLTLMEVETGTTRFQVPGTANGGPLAASPDDRLLAAPRTGPNVVGIWEVATGKEVTTVTTGRVDHVGLAPDNRSLVTTDEGFVRVWDLATGKERGRWALPVAGIDSWGKTFVFRLLVSPDGRRAFTALADGTALVWDLTPVLHADELLVKDSDMKDIATWWADLTGGADRAYAAVWRLAEVKGETVVSFLKLNLKPANVEAFQKIRRHINDLDSESFKVRDQARKELEALGSVAVPALRQAMETNPPLEVRRRLESLLSRPFTYSPETLRNLRAIQVLERIASKEARHLLSELANGMTHAPQTQEAKASLERLSRKEITP